MNGDDIRKLTTTDLERRLEVLPKEVADLRQRVKDDSGKFGIHTTQLQVLDDMITGIVDDQQADYALLKKAASPTEHADRYEALLEKLGGAQDIWRIFRTILDQRNNPQIRPLADLTDLIAADCYGMCMERARAWTVVTDAQFREPPLTYLESSLTPAAASRGQSVQMLGFPVREYRNMMLPLPLVLFPLDLANSIWSMCGILHEVGHNVDHDLDPREGNRLTDAYRVALVNRIQDPRQAQWRRWIVEIFADAVGIVLGGAGFAWSMAHLLVPLGPGSSFQELDTTSEHPPFHLRLRILAEMLSQSGSKRCEDEGKSLDNLWQGETRPAWQQDYEQDVAAIVGILFQTKPVSLKGHTLLEVNTSLDFENKQCLSLAAYFAGDDAKRLDPKANNIPYRFVPAAAAIAVSQLATVDVPELQSLHDRALTYMHDIERPKMLAGPSRREYLKTLTRQLKFGQSKLATGGGNAAPAQN